MEFDTSSGVWTLEKDSYIWCVKIKMWMKGDITFVFSAFSHIIRLVCAHSASYIYILLNERNSFNKQEIESRTEKWMTND